MKASTDHKLIIAQQVISVNLRQKTLWKKGEMLVTSIFSYSHKCKSNGFFLRVNKSQACAVTV